MKPAGRASLVCALLVGAGLGSARAGDVWWPANQSDVISRSGRWEWTSHRYAAESALVTREDGAALEFSFTGRGLVLALDTLTPPNYGPPELGAIEVTMDGKREMIVRPRADANEVVLFRGAPIGTHRVRLVHRTDDGGAGCRLRGVRVLDAPGGDLVFAVSGEQQGALVDVRATLKRDDRVVRDALVRNWLSGECRLAGVPAGDDYELVLRASGWESRRITAFGIREGAETRLPPIYLARPSDEHVDQVKFPAFGRAVVLLPGGSFRTRFEANKAQIRAVRLVRQQGPATISRRCAFEEDKAAAFYYHREGTVTLPGDMPTGVYDLEIVIAVDNTERRVRSRRSVNVVRHFPANPVFVSFGHLDTWGQFQAEYLERLAELTNLIAPDLLLISNGANAAYESGVLYGLETPFVINFGNHRSPEPAAWFGEPIGIMDFGPQLAVLNFGRAWDSGLADAAALLASRSGARIKIINAFEANAPVREFLDQYGVALVHYAHGPGPAITTVGETPTVRVGKVNAESFRVIRFRDGRPVSYTYRGDPTAPIPFPRNRRAPLRLSFNAVNDGSQSRLIAQVENDLDEAFPAARVQFVLPRGKYRVNGARAESMVDSDDGRFTVISARVDVAAQSAATVSVE